MESFAVQRKNMVEHQVRTSDVTDRRILRAMLELPRELFVADEARDLAYSDLEPPMAAAGPASARRLLAPAVLARMVQALALGERHTVLEVGSGTGYGSALLARLAGKVVALEVDGGLADRALRKLARLGVNGVEVVTAPLPGGWEGAAPYDAVLVEGALPEPAPALLDQLKDGGRLVAIRYQAGVGKATRWVRDGASFGEQELFDAAAPVLPGFEREPQFVF